MPPSPSESSRGGGVLEFRNPTMEILPATKPFPVPADFVCEYSPAVKELAGRRGVMSPIPEKITVQDIHDLGGWGPICCVIRSSADSATTAATSRNTRDGSIAPSTSSIR
ncbi:MAG: hypothetical protein L6W00_17105 [Lentisphaeria bacterium]|nr:MAG: hypothetical protein L6W00_17105 [Lentisphaeria bacterium]